MKKKIALLLSALMIVGMIPATAFATTTNTVSKIVTGGVDDVYTAETTPSAPVFKIAEKNLEDLGVGTPVTFKATLTNAEFNFISSVQVDGKDVKIGVGETATLKSNTDISVTMLASNMAIIEAPVDSKLEIKFPIESKLKTEGEATITIDAMESVVSYGTYKFANVVEGSTTTTIEKTVDISEDGDVIKPIVITETSKGALELSSSKEFKLKLTNGFTFDETYALANLKVTASPTGTVGFTLNSTNVHFSNDSQEMYIKIDSLASSSAKTISITGIKVQYDEDDVKAGDVAEITISGNDMTKATVEVAVARNFGVTFTAESKTLPVFYSGRRDTDLDTLKVTMKEVITDSWLSGRKTTITFPKGVKIIDVDLSKQEGYASAKFNIENNELTITDVTTKSATTKTKIEMKFQLSISPDFTGDITAVLGGAGVEEDVQAVLGTAVAPIKVEADSNPVSIDYRNVAIGDIVITEAYAGALEKNKTLSLEIEKGDVEFDGTPTVEVIEGDLKIEDVDTNGGVLTIEVKTASSKTPAVLKVTGVKLYLNRSIPAGAYALKLAANDTISDTEMDNTNGATSGQYGVVNRDVASGTTCNDAFFQNSVTKSNTYKKTTLFDVRSLTVVKDYVNVVTAGRDQGDDTFTTSLSVTIGADKLIAGDKEITLDVPAYIANGYTMLPVRAITEALSSVAIVRWDDATKTVTITFGSRVISMTVGSKTMNINGVAVQMQAACEITDARAFIPLRDLGYALGLNDSKINWDDATKTAKLN